LNAFSVLNLLFRKKDSKFVDRYDLVDPVVAVVDNKRVIDEVEFYIIENQSQV
jgi:hypothetical protein